MIGDLLKRWKRFASTLYVRRDQKAFGSQVTRSGVGTPGGVFCEFAPANGSVDDVDGCA